MTDNKIFNYNINEDFSWSEVNLKGEKEFFVEGYASTIDTDLSGETVEMTAQQDVLNQTQGQNITLDIEHSEWYDEKGNLLQKPKNTKIPVAKIIHSELRPKGVWVKAQLNRHLRSFNEVWGSIKDGFLKAFSIAFYPTQRNGSRIKHLNLVNITLTGSPVNPNATFSVSMKSASAWLDIQQHEQIVTTNPTETVPEITNKNMEANKMPEDEKEKFECKKCDKDFESKEALEEHREKEHSAEVKANIAPVSNDDINATIKAMKEKQEQELASLKAEIASSKTEIASLKAELAKPAMKAVVPVTMPETKPVMQIVSPLYLIK